MTVLVESSELAEEVNNVGEQHPVGGGGARGPSYSGIVLEPSLVLTLITPGTAVSSKVAIFSNLLM